MTRAACAVIKEPETDQNIEKQIKMNRMDNF